ncbi:hypothetical protein [Pedobacter frigoris]|uniref:hypothetical protein n=1 Tax=Pedobacter frigoris TaxID=2571272 RepID=UPI00292D7F8B|nr:hypothetical protein [Pedobacter frigoris]
MAIFNGKHFKGIIGKIVLKVQKNGKLTAQSIPAQVPQTEASQKTAGIMGNASTLSKSIRTSMSSLYGDNYPGTMINNLSTANRSILDHCCDKETMTYAFQEDSFENLAGFQFNDKSPLSNFLWVKPYLTINDSKNQITLTIPAFEVVEQLKMPNHANSCEFYIKMGQFALFGSTEKSTQLQTLEILPEQTHIPETQFQFDIMPGCLGVVGLGIKYYKLQNQVKTPLNNKELNPAAIVGAIFTPGEFIIPKPVTVNGKSKATGWSNMSKLKLNFAEPEG